MLTDEVVAIKLVCQTLYRLLLAVAIMYVVYH